jgi:RNA polymerase sigma-70 factor (ECF subfamily)
MQDDELLARRFESHRPRLHAVALRLLGSTDEADDAVQEAWMRLSRTDATQIENLQAWLVTTVGRVALNLLRARRTRKEEPLSQLLPVPAASGPEQEAELADDLGLALLVVLDAMTPSERLAFVLHDLFSVPFDEVGAVLGRSAEAARQLASRGRRRLRRHHLPRDHEPAAPEVVAAFLTAAREGDFRDLLALLHPDAVQYRTAADGSTGEVHGAAAIAKGASAFARDDEVVILPALVDGRPGLVSYRHGRLVSRASFTVVDGLVREMYVDARPATRGLTGAE